MREEGGGGGSDDKIIVSCLNGSSHRANYPHPPHLGGRGQSPPLVACAIAYLPVATIAQSRRGRSDCTTTAPQGWCVTLPLVSFPFPPFPPHSKTSPQSGDKCSGQNLEIGGCRKVKSRALISNPAPILHERHYCTIDCCVLAYVYRTAW